MVCPFLKCGLVSNGVFLHSYINTMNKQIKVVVWCVIYISPSRLEYADFHGMPCSGGGISGLAFAIAMGKNPNVSVDIYEAAPEFLAVGAGIGIWMRVWELLAKLGLAEALRSKTASATTPDPSMPG